GDGPGLCSDRWIRNPESLQSPGPGTHREPEELAAIWACRITGRKGRIEYDIMAANRATMWLAFRRAGGWGHLRIGSRCGESVEPPQPACDPGRVRGAAAARHRPVGFAIEVGFDGVGCAARQGIAPFGFTVASCGLQNEHHLGIGPLHPGEERPVDQIL